MKAGKQRKSKWVKTVKKREGGAWIPKAAHYLAHFQKSCSSCQNVKMHSAGEFHKLAMFVWLCACNAKFGISDDMNCQDWLIIGYTRGWYTGMRYWKWCLQSPLPPLFPVPRQFLPKFSPSVYNFLTILWPCTGYKPNTKTDVPS